MNYYNGENMRAEDLALIVKLLTAMQGSRRRTNFYNASMTASNADGAYDESLEDRDVTPRMYGYEEEDMSVIPPAKMKDFHRDKGYIENYKPEGYKWKLYI